EIGNRFRQPLSERRGRLPAKDLLRLCNVGLALPWIILRQWPVDNARARVRQFTNDIGKLQHREFDGIAYVDGPDNLIRRSHQAYKALDEILDVAERSRLRTIAVNGDVASEERLDDEIRHHSPVVRMHARSVRIKDACDLDTQFVLTPIIEEQSLGAALTFIVA